VRKGIQAVEEAGAKGGGFSGRLSYFNLKKDGDTTIVRFITDLDKDVITLDFWEFIVDNKDNPQNFAVAADVHEDKNATDYVIEYGGQQKAYGSNELVDPTPKTRSVGLAVECEEYQYEVGGKTKLGYRPTEIDIETKSGVKKGYKFLVVKQAYKNFWGPLKSHWEENNGTICDRYFKIKRVGSGNDTTYTFIEKQPDPAWEEDADAAYEALKAEFGYGVIDAERSDDDRFKFVPQTLEEWAKDSCSEDRVKYFLGDADDRDAADAKRKGATTATDSDDDEDENEAAAAPKSGGGLQARMSRHKGVSAAE